MRLHNIKQHRVNSIDENQVITFPPFIVRLRFFTVLLLLLLLMSINGVLGLVLRLGLVLDVPHGYGQLVFL